MRQLALPVRLRASSVFASFYRGSNGAAIDTLYQAEPAPRSPAIWLHGPSGVGKTHLLQAVCAHAGERNLTAAYFPLADASVRPDALIGCENLSFVCLDDFERIAGRADWERAIFRLYTEFEESGGRLFVAASSPPSIAGVALKDLASRFAAGTVLRIQSLTDEEQIAALILRAAALGLELAPDAAQFLVRRLPRDMPTLCAALDKLDHASLATQRRLTVPFVRDVLERNACG